MAEIFHLEGSDCIGAHNIDRYDDPNALHNRHDFRQNMRIQLSESELALLLEQGAVLAEAVRYGSERPVQKYWVVGLNGQLKDKRIKISEAARGYDKILVSGALCDELRKERFVETSDVLADISLLVKRG